MKKFFDIQSTDFIPDNLAALSREELIKILYKFDANGSWNDDEQGQEPMSKQDAIDRIHLFFLEEFLDSWQYAEENYQPENWMQSATNLYQSYLKIHNLPQISCDELIAELVKP